MVHEPRPDHWRELVHVRPRYQRSVHLERDAHERGSLDGYILTPLVRTLTGRILDGYRAASPARAWSITGPYGTGKSAFAVFLSDALSPPELDASKSARRILATADAPLAATLSGPGGIFAKQAGLCPVLATGERRSLDQVLLNALRDFTQQFWSGRGAKAALVSKVEKAAEAVAKGKPVGTREVVDLFEQTAQKVAESKRAGRGLLVVLDEAGKVLEHAAQHPERGDVQLLQELAEAANRSGESPIVFVVVLHQAFEQYAGRLSLTERSEWAKVQGRFEDLAFQEASHELLRLVGEAIDVGALPRRIAQAVKPIAETCSALVSRGGTQEAKEREALLAASIPLHPVTTLLLGPLFRSRLAQNERSLFAFLASVEPGGFQRFLDTPRIQGDRLSLFLPDALYDYIVASFGSRLHGHLGKQWAQIETALRRLPEGALAIDAQVLKTIALLGLFGDAAGLGASDATLEAIYTDGTDASKQALTAALARLRAASLVIFRKFRNAYQLWEGSDLDVDTLVRNALAQVDATAALVTRLVRVAPPRPIIARRHLFETGTLRYFDLKYLDVSAFDDAFPEVDRNADGSLFLVIEPDATTRSQFLQQIKQPLAWMTASGKPVLVAVPRHVGRLLELGGELAALEWVRTHTPELNDDLVSQREVTMRITEAERQLRQEVARILGGAVACEWLTRDTPYTVGSPVALARIVSDLCDAAYNKAPAVQNELLNRRQLSSAAAAARRSLMEAMVTQAGTPRLGFEGTPPEVSMYRSLLEHHGLHRERDGGLGFGEPIDQPSGSLFPVWTEIERALDEAREARLRVGGLFEQLSSPPYGVCAGLLPVLLFAAVLSWRDEVALYQAGVFLPRIGPDVIDDLVNHPDRIEIQRLSIEGPRAALFRHLASTLSGGATTRITGPVPIVRQLVRVVRTLPSFAQTTRILSPAAQAVRDALLRAKEPAPLLFHALPEACGMPPFGVGEETTSTNPEAFVEALRSALRELRLAYPHLLDTIEGALRDALDLPADADALRRTLARRAARLLPVVADPQLRAFLAMAGEALPREDWLVSIGTLLAGKPPPTWNDGDIDRAQLALAMLRRPMLSLEATLEGVEDTTVAPTRLRMSVGRMGQRELAQVVSLHFEQEPAFAALRSRIEEIAGCARKPASPETVLAAFAVVAEELMAAPAAP